jgi:hypothetical protein
MSVEHGELIIDRGTLKYSEKKLPLCHLICHCPGIEPKLGGEQPGANCLNCSMAYHKSYFSYEHKKEG